MSGGPPTSEAPNPALDAKWRRLQCVVAAMIVLALVGIVSQLWTTDFGFGYSVDGSRVTVTEVDPRGAADRAGIAVGDQIVKDPGLITYQEPWTERESTTWNLLLGEALRSGHVPMRIRRGTTEIDVDVVPWGPTLSATIRQLRRAGPQMPTMFGFLAVAVLLARRPRVDHPTRRMIAYCFAFFGPCWAYNWPAPAWPPWLIFTAIVAINVGAVVGSTLLAYFAWSFPTRSRFVDIRWLRVLLIGTGAFAAVVSILDCFRIVDFFMHGNRAQVFFDLTMVVFMIAGLIWQYRRAGGIVARRQTRFIFFGFVLGLGLSIFGVVGPYMFGINSELMFTIFFPAPVILPLAFAAALLRYRLFDFDGLASKAAVHAIVLVTSLAVYVAITAGLQAALGLRGAEAEGGRWVGIVVVLALGEPLRALGRRLTDRLLARDRADFIARCSKLAANLAHVSDAGVIERAVTSTLDARVARLLDLRDALPGVVLDSQAVARRLEKDPAMRVVELSNPRDVDALLALGIDALVLIPIEDDRGTNKRALGLALPLAAHLWDRAERDALANVGRVIGAAMSFGAARRMLEVKVTRADDERREIAMELHDGTGATLAAARLFTQLARDANQDARGDALEALDRTLREGLVDLRAALWSIDHHDGTWNALAAQVRRHAGDVCFAAGLKFTMSTGGELVDNPSARTRLTVLRVVQEALNNTIRHAKAKSVRCDITASEDRVDVLIEDDGAGLSPKCSGEGRGLRNMKRRVEGMLGTITFESPDGGGTRVVARIPQKQAPKLTSAPA